MLRGAIVGASYFAQYHVEAWRRIAGVEIVGVADVDAGKAETFRARWQLPRAFPSCDALLATTRPDFIDIVTRPDSHLPLARLALAEGVDVICQKPLAPTWAESAEMARLVADGGRRLIVHDNWRWQPWYRWARARIEAGAIGRPHHARVIVRLGDGAGPSPYARQPYFREMSRLLVYETLVHYLDTLSFLLGEIVEVFCAASRRNPAIVGEDTAIIMLRFASDATAIIDATRVSGPPQAPPAFGLCVIEGGHGTITIHPDGQGTVQRSAPEAGPDASAAAGARVSAPDEESFEEAFEPPDPTIGYRGDSVRAAQAHYAACLADGRQAETEIGAYLPIVWAVDACYASTRSGRAFRAGESVRDTLGEDADA